MRHREYRFGVLETEESLASMNIRDRAPRRREPRHQCFGQQVVDPPWSVLLLALDRERRARSSPSMREWTIGHTSS